MFGLSFHCWHMQLHSGQRTSSVWYWFFRSFCNLFYDLRHGQFWYMFHIYMKRRYILCFSPIFTRSRLFYVDWIFLIFINFYVCSDMSLSSPTPLGIMQRRHVNIFLRANQGHSASFPQDALQLIKMSGYKERLDGGVLPPSYASHSHSSGTVLSTHLMYLSASLERTLAPFAGSQPFL